MTKNQPDLLVTILRKIFIQSIVLICKEFLNVMSLERIFTDVVELLLVCVDIFVCLVV